MKLKFLPIFAIFFFCTVNSSLILAATPMSIEDFTSLPAYRDVQISPDGKHLSVVLRRDGQEVLAILNRATLKFESGFHPQRNQDVFEVHWVNNERLVYSLSESYSFDKQRRQTGELVGVNTDGRQHKLIFGYSAGEKSTGSHIKKKKASYGSHEIIDLLRDDEKNILITFYPWKVSGQYWVHDYDAYPKIVKLNVYNGKKKFISTLPIKNSSAIVDNNGDVRFALGINDSNKLVISYKKTASSKWQIFSLSSFEGRSVSPESFTKDNNKVYLSANVGNGTRALYLFDLQNEKLEKLYGNDKVDISDYVYDFSGRSIVAVSTDLGRPKYHYLSDNDKKVKLHKMLKSSFEGYDIYITSVTDDKKYMIVYARADFNPGDFYLFNTENMKADFLLSTKPRVDINQTTESKATEFTTRDGTKLNGYVTLPLNKQSHLPLVVLPHGGPHGVRDYWGYDWEAQLLANRGYAVLQVNYRGSGGFGTDFEEAGYGKWGTLMQDDVTDATKAMIERGIADADRICIYGASYGGYAALMGAIREPDLYKCAIGSAGVYNLPMMFEEGDIAERDSGLAYLKEVLGDNIEDQKARSPAFNVDKIKANLLLIHGGKDERAPIEQVESLKAALDKIHKPYEWLKLNNEGHGYNDEGNRIKIYTKLLDFLDRNIGHIKEASK